MTEIINRKKLKEYKDFTKNAYEIITELNIKEG